MPNARSNLTTADMVKAMKLEPKLAISYFRSRGYALPDAAKSLDNARTKAFTIAEATKLDTVKMFHDQIDKSLKEGLTVDQFIKNVHLSGFSEEGEIAPYRLKSIFRNNMQSSYNEGRHIAQVANSESQPLWMRVEVIDEHTRKTHFVVNGVIYPADDPFWDDNYPPYLAGKYEFGCRGRVRALSQKRFNAMLAKNPDLTISQSKAVETDTADNRISINKSPAYVRDVEMAKKLAQLEDNAVRDQAIMSLNNSKLRQKEWSNWVADTLETKRPSNRVQTLGFMDEKVSNWMQSNAPDVSFERLLAMSEKDVSHAMRSIHKDKNTALDAKDLMGLALVIKAPHAVYFDPTKKRLAYFGKPKKDGRSVMIAIREANKHKRKDTLSTAVTTYYANETDWVKADFIKIR